jgi:hypothetical protein
MAMVDVTREPGVMVNMGGLKSTWGEREQNVRSE